MQRRKILIIDDDRSMLKMLSTFFEMTGYEVLQEQDGRRALNLLEADQFDVVITDLMLDGVSGIDILKKTKQYPGMSYCVSFVIFSTKEMTTNSYGVNSGCAAIFWKCFRLTVKKRCAWSSSMT